MYKIYSFIALLFFTNVSVGMERKEIHNSSYSSRVNDQRKKQNAIKPITTIHNSIKSSAITKPHRTVEQKKQNFPFIYDKYTARRGNPKMLNIYCDDCGNLLIKYQKDGPGRLLRCYLDRIHSPESLKNRQYEAFNVHTAQNLSCQNQDCRLIIGRPMIYPSETRPAYRMDNRCFYMQESK
jgi:hypothetical protein